MCLCFYDGPPIFDFLGDFVINVEVNNIALFIGSITNIRPKNFKTLFHFIFPSV